MRFVGICQYDGSNYSGFQSQKNASSIQDHLEVAISSIGVLEERINYAGRTDRQPCWERRRSATGCWHTTSCEILGDQCVDCYIHCESDHMRSTAASQRPVANQRCCIIDGDVHLR